MRLRRKLNRKGFFMSLIALFVLVMITFILTAQIDQESQKAEIKIDYKKSNYVADFVQDFKTYYLPSMISTSQKYAFEAISDDINDSGGTPLASMNDLYDLLEDVMVGNPAGVQILQNKTLKYLLALSMNETVFTPASITDIGIDVLNVIQPTNMSIQMEWNASYNISSSNINWSDWMMGNTTISVNTLMYPPKQVRIKSYLWIVNETDPDCYMSKIVNGFACDSAKAICIGTSPPAQCNTGWYP